MKPIHYLLIAFTLGPTAVAFAQPDALIFIGQDQYGHTKVYTEDGSPFYDYKLHGHWTESVGDSVFYLYATERGWDTMQDNEHTMYPYSFYYMPVNNAGPYRVISQFEDLMPFYTNIYSPFTGEQSRKKRKQADTFYTAYYPELNRVFYGGDSHPSFQREIRDQDGRLVGFASGYGMNDKDTSVSPDLRGIRCSYTIHYNHKGKIAWIEGVGEPFPNQVFNTTDLVMTNRKHIHQYIYDSQGRLKYIVSSFGVNGLKETKTLSPDYLKLIRQLGSNCSPDKSPWDQWPGVDYLDLMDMDSAAILSLIKGRTKTVEETILDKSDEELSDEEIQVKKLLRKNLKSDVYWALHQPQVVEFTYGKWGPVTARLYTEDRTVSAFDSVVYDDFGRVSAFYSGSCPYGDEFMLTKYIYDASGHLTDRIDERHTLAERDTPALRYWQTSWVKEMYAYDEKGRMVQVSQTWDDADTTYVQCRFGYK